MQEKTIKKYKKGEKMFLEGKTLTEVGELLHLDRGKFSLWLRKRGIKTKEDVTEKYKKGLEMYLNGTSLTKIARGLKMGRKNFTKWLKKQGVDIIDSSKKYKYNESYFEKIDSEEKAYWLGFIYADGCVTERYGNNDNLKSMSLEMALCKKDKNHLVKFAESIETDKPIINKTITLGNKKFKACVLKIHSTKICRDLVSLGCTPRKSLTLNFPTKQQVPEYLLKHFIRGYVDGDGWIGISTNKKNARISIEGTCSFLKDLQKAMFWRETKIYKKKQSNIYILEYGALDTLSYISGLYKNATVYLDRKYKKYKEMIAVLGGNS